MAARRESGVKKKSHLLVVDDERAIRDTLIDILEGEGYRVTVAADGKEAVQQLKDGVFDTMLCDIKMPGMDGIEVLDFSVKHQPDMPVVMVSGHGTIETAVDALKRGAYDYIEKPLDLNRLLVSIRNALDRSSLIEETRVLRKHVESKYEMVGNSPAMQSIRSVVERVAPTTARVLITGENGTGKELVARALHQLSEVSSAPFVEVNCAAIPSELIESELFGHEKGAFTSAIKQRLGKFELANGGTLFLDEIGDMSLSAQSKVLRALQENKITRVGGEKEIEVSPRVIAATNKDLRSEIEAGRFREDLYHRLSVILIEVPPLRERVEDIPVLVESFLTEICAQNGIAKRSITPGALSTLATYPWKGNIRELRNVVERLVIMTDGDITAEDVSCYVRY